jgi:hypothetical protein
MNVKWLIENFTGESSYAEMSDEIIKQGMELTHLNKNYKHSDLDKFRDGNQCVMFLGSIEMTEIVRKQLPNCFPVAYCTFENYLCSKYMSHYGDYLFNDKYAIISLGELQRQKFFYYGMFGKEAIIFIRPDSGQKTFQAQLKDFLDIDRFVDGHPELKHDLVVISTPKNIRWEGRFICTRNKEILSHSTYQFQGQVTKIPTVPTGTLNLVKEILEVGYYPDSVFCIDICEDNDGTPWLLEINSFSSAGLYASKKEPIVRRVSEIAMEEWSRNKESR